MHRNCSFVLAAVCVLSAGPAARADQITSTEVYSWGYKFGMGPNPVHSFVRPSSITTIIVPGTGSNSNMQSPSGSSTSISTSVWEMSSATAYNPQMVGRSPFDVRLQITDNASGDSKWVSFRGYLSGDVWNTGSTLQPIFNGSLVRTVDINHHLYTVQFTSFTSPGGNGDPGQFHFNVTVAHNPEPSTLLLAGIGAPLLGWTLRRRRKR